MYQNNKIDLQFGTVVASACNRWLAGWLTSVINGLYKRGWRKCQNADKLMSPDEGTYDF